MRCGHESTRVTAAWLLLLVLAPAAHAAEPKLPPPAQRPVKFVDDIQPIFARHCYACHGMDQQKSGYRLDQKEPAFAGGELGEKAIVTGSSAESPLIRYVAGVADGLVMPPKGKRLSAEEVGLLRAWIDQGADWPADASAATIKLTTKHWSFQPLTSVSVPAVQHPYADTNPLDAFVLEKLRAQGLQPAPPADRVTFLRRLYFDMWGLPPTWEEIQAFVADDRPDAHGRAIDRVLASPRYGERWARHWLDVVRFAETNGFETNVERPNAWHYRDYVIAAFNDDKPYDRFVFEQLAGDSAGADAATGFLVGGPWDQVKSPDPVLTAMQRSDELADMTSTTGTAFLGLTVGCARCHNHKFDPILQKDYFALQAVFAGVQHGERRQTRTLSTDEEERQRQLRIELAGIEKSLQDLQPRSQLGTVLLLDDETLVAADGRGPGTRLLADKAGHGNNPAGTARGEKSDPGDFSRLPNVSRGRYTWWRHQAGQDVFAYYPQASGRQRVWLSWGCGYATHSQDAQYVLDDDGDPQTKQDQRVIATIDQQQRPGEAFATLPAQPLWSGFVSAGVHDFRPGSAIIVRGGKTGTALTADTIAFEMLPEASNEQEQPLQPALRPAVNARENFERFSPVEARFIRFTITSTNNGTEPCLDELEVYGIGGDATQATNVALGAKVTSSGDYQGNPFHRLTHLNDGAYGNARSWISNTAGTGWVEIELPEAYTIERMVWGRDRQQQYRDRLPTAYRIEVAMEPGKWQVVASSRDRIPSELAPVDSSTTTLVGLTSLDAAQAKELLSRRQSRVEQLNALADSPLVYAGNFQTPGATHRLFRGDPMQPREVVAPDCLTVLGTLGLQSNTAEQQRRIALAKWIASSENPLTARVMVNRVWLYHFGTGLVDTPSDVGVNGAPPSHPELLDWLALRFVEEGWSLKRLHRLILSSHTYRQASTPNAKGLEVDAQSRLLWRYPPHRLEAEAIRDTILATSGTLDLRMRGAGWSAFAPNTNYVRVYEPKETFGPMEWRRAIYMTKVRMRHDGVFGAFDCPDAGQIAPKRARSTTALQALNLFNSQLVLDQAGHFAQRLQREAGESPAAQVLRGFQVALGREPTTAEHTAASKLVQEHGLAPFCRALLNANEFLFIP